jgi:phage repressor protein C with HTH and peptisase S24 domain
MQSFTERFQQLIQEYANGNRSEFGRKTGKTPGQITDICKGRGKPTFDYLLKLTKMFNINIHWLVSGDGEMFLGPPMPANSSVKDFVYVPRYDVQVSAGYGSIVNNEQIVDYLAFKHHWVVSDLKVDPLKLALLTVDGDSMDPTIKHSDLLLVDMEQHRIIKDAIYVIRIDEALMAKRIQRRHDGGLNVISDNPAYREFVINKDELESLQVLGRVVWFGRQV